MSLWNRNPDRNLERRLRGERPQAREEFVRTLAGEAPIPVAAPRARRSALRRVVVIFALTATLAGALGVAGAIGYATKSVNTFGNNVERVFSSQTQSHTYSGSDGKGDCKSQGDYSGNNKSNNYGNNDKDCKGGDPGNPFHDPFHHVYGIVLPICDPHGNLTTAPIGLYFFDIFVLGYYPASTNDDGKTFFCGPKPSF